MEVTGVAGVGRQRFTPQPRDNLRYQIVDALSHIRGAHYLKMGFDTNHIQISGALPAHFGGRYIFSALPAIPGRLPGRSRSTSAGARSTGCLRARVWSADDRLRLVSDLSLYAQDDWTVRRGLTLKLGLRYQKQFWPDRPVSRRPGSGGTAFQQTPTISRRAWRSPGVRRLISARRYMRRTACSTTSSSRAASRASPTFSTGPPKVSGPRWRVSPPRSRHGMRLGVRCRRASPGRSQVS